MLSFEGKHSNGTTEDLHLFETSMSSRQLELFAFVHRFPQEWRIVAGPAATYDHEVAALGR